MRLGILDEVCFWRLHVSTAILLDLYNNYRSQVKIVQQSKLVQVSDLNLKGS